jgi:undecaprenyl-diphosphatase
MIITHQQKNRLLIAVCTLSVSFLLLTTFVFYFPFSVVDKEFSEEIQEHPNALLDALMKAVSWFGNMPNSVIVVLLTAILFFLFHYKREALFILTTQGAGVISSIIKVMVNRPRPSQSLVRIIEITRQQSFPSGHVVFYIVFFGFLALLMLRLAVIPKFIRIGVSGISFLLILTIPFSRIYLGAHWFTDVLGGFLLGVLCLLANSYYYLKKVIIFTKNP